MFHHARRRQCIGAKALAVTILAALATVLSINPATADNIDPKALLKSMSDFLAQQSTISVTFNSNIEVVTPTLEKIQFDSSSTVELKRPNKVRVERTGGYAAVELVFDGSKVTLYDKDSKRFVQASAGGTIDDLIEHMRGDLGINAPGADLLLSNVYAALSADILTGTHIGQGVIDGVECEHLAFRNADTDWQLWVKPGSQPLPCKMVITSKTVAAAPQYTIEIKDWKLNTPIDDKVFEFQAHAADAKAELKDLAGTDELPPSAAPGGAQP
jgi:hypothetical protein